MAAVPAFKPTVMSQAGQDALKQSLQGVSFSNVTPPPTQRPFIGPILSGDRPMVNVPAPVSATTAAGTNQPPASFTGTLQGPYPSYDANGKVTSVQAGMNVVNGVPQPNVPAPAASGAPKFDAAGIAASRVAAQRAALAGSVTAFDASRKSAFDYMTKNTQDQRVLDGAMFHEQNDPFGGKYQYDKTNILRNNNIQDTQNQANYQNDLAASDAKLAAFDAGAPGMQQDIQQQLEHQNLQDNIAQAPYTGMLNGRQTQQAQAQGFNQNLQQNQNNFNQNLQTNQFNQQAQNQQFNQGMQTQQFAYQQARDSIKDKQYQQTFDNNVKQQGLDFALKQATLANQITNDQAQRAIGYMNANTSQQQANTSAANSAANISNLSADNQRQQAEFDQKQKDTNYQKSFDNLKSLYTAKDQFTGVISVTNPQQLRAAILAKNLSDDETIQMLSDFGLPIKQ